MSLQAAPVVTYNQRAGAGAGPHTRLHALVLPQPVYQEFASLRPPLGGRTGLVNVKNFHASLTTVVKAQNDTSKTAIFTFSILHVERYTRPYRRSHAKMEGTIA